MEGEEEKDQEDSESNNINRNNIEGGTESESGVVRQTQGGIWRGVG